MLATIAVQYALSVRRAPGGRDAASTAQIDRYRKVWFGAQALPWLVVGVGILSGGLHDFWGIFRLRDGNPFAWGFVATMAALTWSLAWWVFSGGAKKVVELRLMDQISKRGVTYTERGVKLMAGLSMLAPLGFVFWSVVLMGNGEPFGSEVHAQSQVLSVSADGYQVVYDLAQAGFHEWAFAGVGLIFVVVGAVLVYFRKDIPIKGPVFMQRVFPFVFLAFGLFWMIGVFSSTLATHRRLAQALEEGNTRTVTGEVGNFVPMPEAGHALERFCVQQTCFAYSDFVSDGGFNNTASHGGPIRAGLPVRVTFVGTVIVKLEIAPQKAPAAP